jgi:hypothetical protein
MFLNADIPVFYCLLRKEFLYDQRSHQNEFEKVAVFGVASIPSRAVLFHVMTERGAQIARVPINALVSKETAPQIPLDYLELWDNFSYEIAVTKFEFLKGLRCRTVFKDRQWYDGEYMFTLDWCGSETAEDVGEGGHKNAHILRLDNGCFAAQPNNRILWYEPAFITNPYGPGERPDFLTNSHIWKCEGVSKWATEDSPAMFYDIAPVNGKGNNGS